VDVATAFAVGLDEGGSSGLSPLTFALVSPTAVTTDAKGFLTTEDGNVGFDDVVVREHCDTSTTTTNVHARISGVSGSNATETHWEDQGGSDDLGDEVRRENHDV
jgi:hypothetical protein